MRRLALVLSALCLVACGGSPAVGGANSADARSAAAAAERADDALRSVYAEGDGTALEGVLGGRALKKAQRQVLMLTKTGARREEQLLSRRAVHESVTGGRAEVVLLISARQRVVRPGVPAAAFSTVLRQWRATLARQGSGWLVIDDGDLQPAQWWPS